MAEESFLTKWERVIKATPLNGYVMEPQPDWQREAASIICGHDLVQHLTEAEQNEFEMFVREVLRTSRAPHPKQCSLGEIG